MESIKFIVISICKIYSSKIINKFSTEYIHICIHMNISFVFGLFGLPYLCMSEDRHAQFFEFC